MKVSTLRIQSCKSRLQGFSSDLDQELIQELFALIYYHGNIERVTSLDLTFGALG
jgi:hypothetical protein